MDFAGIEIPLSELVRRARSEGPQRITVCGEDDVVIISALVFHRLSGGQTGADLIAAMQACPGDYLEFPQQERLEIFE